MAASNYDPFSMRKKKTPDFPSVFGGRPGRKPIGFDSEATGQVGATNIGNFYRTPGTPQSNDAFGVVPDFPADAMGAQGPIGVAAAIPEFPNAQGGWQKGTPIPPVDGAPAVDKDGDGIPDAQFASDIIGQMDQLLKSIDSPGSQSGASEQEPQAGSDPAETNPADAQRDRSWMFQPRDGWDGPKRGGGNYTPAPVTFKETQSSDWGTALDRRPERSGPAASTVRYYERAQARAEGGGKADRERINRLRLRINGRPTNG